MPIHFEKERFEEIKKNYASWWNGGIKRPIVKITVSNSYLPDTKRPRAPVLSQQNCHDFSYSAEELIETLDWEFSQHEFLGDAFPFVNFASFGPGVLAAFCGAKLDNSSGAVWFFPEEELEIEDIHIIYDANNKWVERIKSIYRAGLKKWNGKVLMGMPDLGGILDVVATFRGSENLLMDLYDAPDEVKRLCNETEIAWKAAYVDLNSVLQPINDGYTDWSGIYSAEPSYIIQSDFCYMISAPMFDEFVLPSIEKSCKELTNIIYHLDGIGELNHLDSLLKTKDLNAVQWVYGDGQPSAKHWLDVYKKISSSGKGVYLVGNIEDFEVITKNISAPIYFPIIISKQEKEDVLKKLQM